MAEIISQTQPETSITVTPMLSVENAEAAIAFYKEAFGATETVRMMDEAGKIAHAEIRIGNAPIMLSDTYPEAGAVSPPSLGGSPVMLLLDVPDIDTAFAQAIGAGAKLVRPIQGAPGDALRNGKIIDPFGHRWMLITRRPVP